MKNDYEVRGNVTVIFIKRRDKSIVETLISTEKLGKAQEFPNTWCVGWNVGTKSFYVIGALHEGNGKFRSVKLHRWIMDAPKGMTVDHFNHDTLENTESNLRLVTISENGQNRKGSMINSKSGVLGVSWSKYEKKWIARLNVNNKRIQLGYFHDKEEAERAVIEARKKYMPYSQEASA